MNDQFITQVSGEIKKSKKKQISQDMCVSRSRILGVLSSELKILDTSQNIMGHNGGNHKTDDDCSQNDHRNEVMDMESRTPHTYDSESFFPYIKY